MTWDINGNINSPEKTAQKIKFRKNNTRKEVETIAQWKYDYFENFYFR